MRRLLACLFASLPLCLAAAHAKPCQNPSAVAATREAAEAQCACASATRHHRYMSCVSRVAHEAAASGTLPRRCRAAVMSCARRSVCGKPRYVTCCRTTARGTTTCAIKRSADACLAHPPKGGQAYLSPFSSACDACPDGDCTSATTTTTTSSTTTTLPIVLFDLGHTAEITSLDESDSRLVSQDQTAHWVLWDIMTRRAVLEGDGRAILAGTTLAVVGGGVLRVNDATTGALRFSIPTTPAQAGVAQDGSYVWTADSSALSLWSSLDGHNLVTRSGAYDTARLFAAPDAVRVALGPAGSHVIERIGTDGSRTMTAPFSGDFSSWFTDGQHFLTTLGTAVWGYDAAAVQTGIWSLPTTANLTGQGAYFWTLSPDPVQLTVYSLTGGAAPAATYDEDVLTKAFGVGSVIGVVPYGTGALRLIDLSGSSPVVTSYQIPVAYLQAFTADASGHWAVGNRHGVVYDSDAVTHGLPPLGLGNAFSVAGAATGRAAAATAGGSILLFDVLSSVGPTGTIAFASSHVEMSSDGTVLGAAGNSLDAQYWPDQSLNLYSLPAATLSASFPYTFASSPHFFGFSLSESGARFGRITGTFGGTWHFEREIEDASGMILTDAVPGPGGFDSSNIPPILLAPAGAGIALPDQPRSPTATTRIYSNATLVSAVSGYAVGWLADDLLLVDTYALAGTHFPVVAFAGSRLYDAGGTFVTTSPLPEIESLQVVSGTRVYDRLRNVVYDAQDGSIVWRGPDLLGSQGAVAGPYVVFPTDGHLVAARY
jgi:hypothetical protein